MRTLSSPHFFNHCPMKDAYSSSFLPDLMIRYPPDNTRRILNSIVKRFRNELSPVCGSETASFAAFVPSPVAGSIVYLSSIFPVLSLIVTSYLPSLFLMQLVEKLSISLPFLLT